jgi:hypothetical protein
MAKGGARSRSGPAPDPEALKRAEDWGAWTELPASGRTGRVPAWPLATATARERAVWKRLWKLPQAIEWEREHQHDVVALYVRRFVEAEEHGAPAALTNVVKQLAEGLGITKPGLLRNRWRIVDRTAAAPAAPEPKAARRRSSSRAPARDRLTVVQGDA